MEVLLTHSYFEEQTHRDVINIQLNHFSNRRFVERGNKTRILIFKAIDICRCRVTLGLIWTPDGPCQVRRGQVMKIILRC